MNKTFKVSPIETYLTKAMQKNRWIFKLISKFEGILSVLNKAKKSSGECTHNFTIFFESPQSKWKIRCCQLGEKKSSWEMSKMKNAEEGKRALHMFTFIFLLGHIFCTYTQHHTKQTVDQLVAWPQTPSLIWEIIASPFWKQRLHVPIRKLGM